MKKSFLKRLGAIALSLTVLLGMAPAGMTANAEEACGEGNHVAGADLYDANYNPCTGGYSSDFYQCIYCGRPVDQNCQEIEAEKGIGHHTPGEKHEADYTSCGGGFKEKMV